MTGFKSDKQRKGFFARMRGSSSPTQPAIIQKSVKPQKAVLNTLIIKERKRMTQAIKQEDDIKTAQSRRIITAAQRAKQGKSTVIIARRTGFTRGARSELFGKNSAEATKFAQGEGKGSFVDDVRLITPAGQKKFGVRL